MKKQNKAAVARWVAAGKEHLVVIRPFEKGLALHTMFYADEVRDFDAIDLEEAPVRDKEIQLAETLINELTEKTFNPMQFKDEYRERLLEQIRAKARGKTIEIESHEEEKGGEVIDIMEALRRSLGAGRTPAKRAAPKRTASRKRAPAKRRKVS